MRRREFLGALGGALAASPLAAQAQQHDKIARVGLLGPSREKNVIAGRGYAIFLAEIRKLGFADGQNLQVGRIWPHRRRNSRRFRRRQ
jgi:ribosomal protein L13E